MIEERVLRVRRSLAVDNSENATNDARAAKRSRTDGTEDSQLEQDGQRQQRIAMLEELFGLLGGS